MTHASAARSRAQSGTNRADDELKQLQGFATAHGRALHDVDYDGACQSHALLHALNTQLDPPRARGVSVGTLRHSLLELLNNDQLTAGLWIASGYGDRSPGSTLRAHLNAIMTAQGESFDEWRERLRDPFEWGDGATLIAAALKFKVRIHVLSAAGRRW